MTEPTLKPSITVAAPGKKNVLDDEEGLIMRELLTNANIADYEDVLNDEEDLIMNKLLANADIAKYEDDSDLPLRIALETVQRDNSDLRASELIYEREHTKIWNHLVKERIKYKNLLKEYKKLQQQHKKLQKLLQLVQKKNEMDAPSGIKISNEGSTTAANVNNGDSDRDSDMNDGSF